MSLYGKKILGNEMDARIEDHKETMEAILWEVIAGQRIARVKIQASDILITARYPLNWETTPVWLKKGNAVKINLVGGIRGRVELIGHGALVPSPVTGEMFPAIGTAADTVLSGMQVLAQNPPTMNVNISVGSYRINGVTYYLDAVEDAGISAAPPSAGTFRIDKIVVGEDEEIDVVSGVESSNPVEPVTPADHLKLGTILLYGGDGMTTVQQLDINRPFTSIEAQYVSLSFTPDELDWETLTSTGTATVRDQYGNNVAYAPGTENWDFEFSIVVGNGTLDEEDEFPVLKSGSSSMNVTYERLQMPGDLSPLVKVAVTNAGKTMENYFRIQLLNEDGDPIG